MVSGEKQFRSILSRVLNQGPCSIVIENEGVDGGTVIDGFLSACQEPLSQARILPVRVDCSEYDGSLSTWKGIASQVRLAIPVVFEGNELTEGDFAIIDETDDTDDVQSYLVEVLEEMREYSQWKLLLILENFASAIESMPVTDMMKVREMSSTLTLMSVSREPLATLGDRHYRNAYFCNQFETYCIDE